MIKVNAGVILFLLFNDHKRFCLVSELVEIKRKIEDQLKGVYVDVARKHVLAYVQHYPEYFTWDNGCIRRNKLWLPQAAQARARYEASGVPKSCYAKIESIISDAMDMEFFEEEVVI